MSNISIKICEYTNKIIFITDNKVRVLCLSITLVSGLVLYYCTDMSNVVSIPLDLSAIFHSLLMFSLRFMNIQISFISYPTTG